MRSIGYATRSGGGRVGCLHVRTGPPPDPRFARATLPLRGRAIAYGNSRVQTGTWTDSEPPVLLPKRLASTDSGHLAMDLRDFRENKPESERNSASQHCKPAASERPIPWALFFKCDSPAWRGR